MLSLPLLTSCALFKKSSWQKKRTIPKYIVVFPLDNQSQDLTAPYLVRYFLEKELKRKRFRIAAKFDEVDKQLKQMDITQVSQLQTETIQQAGQLLKAESVLHGTLIEFSQDLVTEKTVARAELKITEVKTGLTLWQQKIDLTEKRLRKIPIRGVLSTNLSYQQIHSIAKTSAGDLPKKIAREAIKSIPK